MPFPVGAGLVMPQARQWLLAGFGAQPGTSHVALAECILAYLFKHCAEIDRNRAMWQRKMRLRSISRMMGGR
ncbi:hypothetical protein CJZ35_25640 [Salmonella enterica subsp. enterica serovar Braenderup]|nr:hypothetical protein CJZ35_25640 [Salmonella enterica subsp. enterica serovar Braenderup]